MNKFVVIGGLWFDKINGNTYNVAKILDCDTGTFYYTDYCYGYGHQYYQEAKEYIRYILGSTDFKLYDMGSGYYHKTDLINHNF